MMSGHKKEIIWLVDGEDFLARLLEIKLAPLGRTVQRLNPKQLIDSSRLKLNPVKSSGLVIVSLPQHGVSSRDILIRIKEFFPGHKVINLMPMGQTIPEDSDNFSEENSFPKPLKDLDSFFQLLTGSLGKYGWLSKKNIRSEIVSL